MLRFARIRIYQWECNVLACLKLNISVYSLHFWHKVIVKEPCQSYKSTPLTVDIWNIQVEIYKLMYFKSMLMSLKCPVSCGRAVTDENVKMYEWLGGKAACESSRLCYMALIAVISHVSGLGCDMCKLLTLRPGYNNATGCQCTQPTAFQNTFMVSCR